MASNKYPRVLLITGQTFNQYTATGITLTNLFRGWSAGRIAMTYQDDSYGRDNSICQRFYKIGTREIGWVRPLSMLKFLRSAEKPWTASADSINTITPNSAAKINKDWRKLALMALGDPEPLRRVHVSDELRAWVEEFKPEVIYSDFSTLTELRFVRELVSLTGASLATHTLDDWPRSKYSVGCFAAYARYKLRKELQSIFNQASLRIGICDKMCQEYEDRYGLPFVPFHNVVELEAWEEARRKSWRAHTPFRIVHSGNIGGIAKIQSLLDICQVVRELHNSGKSIELRIHILPTKASLYRSILESPPSVTVHDPPGNGEFVSLLSGADLLILPVDFGAERIIYYKYSMPTRLPAYMMSGTPILVYGPPEVAVVEYAQKAGLGYIVSQRDRTALKEAIILLSSKVELRRQLGMRAQELAVQHHGADKVREAFRQAMLKAASYPG